MPNSYYNRLFGEGREGLIQMRAGGDMALKESDEVAIGEIEGEKGIAIKHGGDLYDTVTFMPWGNVAYIRTKLVKQAHGVLPLVPVAEIGSGDSDGDDAESPYEWTTRTGRYRHALSRDGKTTLCGNPPYHKLQDHEFPLWSLCPKCVLVQMARDKTEADYDDPPAP